MVILQQICLWEACKQPYFLCMCFQQTNDELFPCVYFAAAWLLSMAHTKTISMSLLQLVGCHPSHKGCVPYQLKSRQNGKFCGYRVESLLGSPMVQVSHKFNMTCVEHVCGTHVKCTAKCNATHGHTVHVYYDWWVHISEDLSIAIMAHCHIINVSEPARINHVSANYTELCFMLISSVLSVV